MRIEGHLLTSKSDIAIDFACNTDRIQLWIRRGNAFSA
jgi:hypothetical protein